MYKNELFYNTNPLTNASNINEDKQKVIVKQLKEVKTIIISNTPFEEQFFDLTYVRSVDFADVCENIAKKYYKGTIIQVLMNDKVYVFKPKHEIRYCIYTNLQNEEIDNFINSVDVRNRIKNYKTQVKLGKIKNCKTFNEWIQDVYNRQITEEYFEYYNSIIATFRTNFAYVLSKHRNDNRNQYKSKNINNSDYYYDEFAFNTKNMTDYYNIKARIGTEKALENLKYICLNPEPLTEIELEELKRYAYVYGVVENPSDIGKVSFTKTHRSTPHGYTEEVEFHEQAVPYYTNYNKTKKEDLRTSSEQCKIFRIPYTKDNAYKARNQYEILQYLKSQGSKYLRAGYIICPKCGSIIKETETCMCSTEQNPITIVSEDQLYNYGYEMPLEQYEERELIHLITEQPELINTIRTMFTSDDIKERPEVVLEYIKNEIRKC